MFNYLGLIEKKGVQNNYIQELAQKTENAFNYKEFDYSTEALAELSTLMQEVPVNELYTQDLIPKQLKPQEISAVFKYLTSENANITYASPQEPYRKTSKYYQAKYQVDPFDVRRFTNQTIANNFQNQLQLPSLSHYIAKDFSINNPKNLIRTQPELLKNPYDILIYAMPSQYFHNNPDVQLEIQITNPIRFTRDKDYLIPAIANDIFYQKFSSEYSLYDNANIEWFYDLYRGQKISLNGTTAYAKFD